MLQSTEGAGLLLLAPAKLNLTLEVLGKRSDGFHQIRSVLQTVELWDSIYMESKPTGVDFHCSRPNLENPENLVLRVVEKLKRTQDSKGVSIRLHKVIPEAAGLGGGSSDAAVTLKGLDYLWRTDLGQERLSDIAGELSSDAPFFLVGGTAHADGRGETIIPLPPLPTHWAVILMPDISVPHPKTARLYGSLTPEHYTQGEHTTRLVDELTANRATSNITELLFNVFESVAFQIYPGLLKYREYFKQAGELPVHIAGSGPALFTITPDKERAKNIYNSLKKEKLEVYLARTGN